MPQRVVRIARVRGEWEGGEYKIKKVGRERFR
jgi:hypothetical protein